MGASFSYLCSQKIVLIILAIHLDDTGGYTFALGLHRVACLNSLS
jgi:hypothetical protein